MVTRSGLTTIFVFTLIGGIHGTKCSRKCFKIRAMALEADLEWTKLGALQFAEGDNVMMNDGTPWIAVSDDELYTTMFIRKRFFVTRLSKRMLENPNELAAKFSPSYPKGWSANQALALIKRLINRDLPYGPWFCNENHYMRYIILAETWAPRFKWSCPLRRDLRNVSPEEITADNFFLLDGTKKPKVFVKDMPEDSVHIKSPKNRSHRLKQLFSSKSSSAIDQPKSSRRPASRSPSQSPLLYSSSPSVSIRSS